jgi:hypothetical protein
MDDYLKVNSRRLYEAAAVMYPFCRAERQNKKLLKMEEAFIHSAWTRLSKG